MSAEAPPRLKFLIKTITKANGAKGVRKGLPRQPKEGGVNPQIPWNKPEHGEKIWVFKHVQKNHMVYSLSKVLNNNDSLRQLPFNGKKTVPRALRKDLWFPFAQISFPPGRNEIGLSCYQKLREFRRRHELEWGDEIRLNDKGQPASRKHRGRKICDQKANTVADMAAVFNRLAIAKGEENAEESVDGEVIGEVKGKRSLQWKLVDVKPGEANAKTKRKANRIILEKIKELREKNIGLKGEGTGTTVRILWNDMADAEFAQEWEENVEHGVFRRDVSSLKALQREIVEDFLEEEEVEVAEALAEGEADPVVIAEEAKSEGERQKL